MNLPFFPRKVISTAQLHTRRFKKFSPRLTSLSQDSEQFPLDSKTVFETIWHKKFRVSIIDNRPQINQKIKIYIKNTVD